MLRWSPICVSVKCATCPSMSHSSQNYMCSFPKLLPWLHGAGHKQNTVYCSFLEGICGLTDEAKMWAIWWKDSGNWNETHRLRKRTIRSQLHTEATQLCQLAWEMHTQHWSLLCTGQPESPILRMLFACQFFLSEHKWFQGPKGQPCISFLLSVWRCLICAQRTQK